MKFSKSLLAVFLVAVFLSSASGAMAKIIYPAEIDPYADPQTIKQIIGGIIDLYREFGGQGDGLPATFFVGDRIYQAGVTLKDTCYESDPIRFFLTVSTYEKDLSSKYSMGEMLVMEREGSLPQRMISEIFVFNFLENRFIGYDKSLVVYSLLPIESSDGTIQTHLRGSKIQGTLIGEERYATRTELQKIIGAFRYHLNEVDTALRWKIIEKGPRP